MTDWERASQQQSVVRQSGFIPHMRIIIILELLSIYCTPAGVITAYTLRKVVVLRIHLVWRPSRTWRRKLLGKQLQPPYYNHIFSLLMVQKTKVTHGIIKRRPQSTFAAFLLAVQWVTKNIRFVDHLSNANLHLKKGNHHFPNAFLC